MDNVRFFVSELDGSEWAEIQNADGGLTTMLKSTYDELQAQINSIVE